MFIIGVGSLSASAISDILNALGIIDTFYLFHVGTFIFLLCQSNILIRKYATSFQVIEAQKVDLGKQNLSLSQELQRRKHAEKALHAAVKQEKYALVGQVAGKIAHDFNNVLGVIMGNSELAMINCKEEKTRHTLKLIYDQTLRGRNLTRNLIVFAKNQEPKQDYFNMNDKITLVRDLLKKDLENITFIMEKAENLPDILADSDMTEHALINLIQNSIHATSLLSSRTISVKTYSNSDSVFVEIEDNGCGIPEKFISRIYEPSFTLKGSKDGYGSYQPGIKGTGYGMSNVKKYVEQHNGTINVSSTTGTGTKFIIALPAVTNKMVDDDKNQSAAKI